MVYTTSFPHTDQDLAAHADAVQIYHAVVRIYDSFEENCIICVGIRVFSFINCLFSLVFIMVQENNEMIMSIYSYIDVTKQRAAQYVYGMHYYSDQLKSYTPGSVRTCVDFSTVRCRSV